MPGKALYKKELLLWVTTIVLMLVTYQFGIKKTWNAYIINKELKSDLGAASNLSFQPDYEERKNRNLDKILNKYRLDSLVFRGQAIAQISAIAEKEGVRLVEIPAQDPFLNSDKSILQKLDFTGDYYKLTRFIQHLHLQENIGVVRSLNLKTYSTEPSKPKSLVLEIYLQILK